MAIRVGEVRRTTFAAPSYIRKNGKPEHPEDLTHHKIIHPPALEPSANWRYEENGKPISIRIKSRLIINTNDAVLAAGISGGGVSRLLSYQVAPAIREKKLVPILKEFEPPSMPIYILHQEGRIVSARVRSFVDFLSQKLRSNPALK